MLKEAHQQGKKIEAISWCSLFCEDAVLKGEAFLPKYDWLRFVLQQKELINASLEKLGLPKLSGWYWVATEANPRCAWCLNADNGDSDYCLKLEEKSVRPMFWVGKATNKKTFPMRGRFFVLFKAGAATMPGRSLRQGSQSFARCNR